MLTVKMYVDLETALMGRQTTYGVQELKLYNEDLAQLSDEQLAELTASLKKNVDHIFGKQFEVCPAPAGYAEGTKEDDIKVETCSLAELRKILQHRLDRRQIFAAERKEKIAELVQTIQKILAGPEVLDNLKDANVIARSSYLNQVPVYVIKTAWQHHAPYNILLQELENHYPEVMHQLATWIVKTNTELQQQHKEVEAQRQQRKLRVEEAEERLDDQIWEFFINVAHEELTGEDLDRINQDVYSENERDTVFLRVLRQIVDELEPGWVMEPADYMVELKTLSVRQFHTRELLKQALSILAQRGGCPDGITWVLSVKPYGDVDKDAPDTKCSYMVKIHGSIKIPPTEDNPEEIHKEKHVFHVEISMLRDVDAQEDNDLGVWVRLPH